MTESSLNRPKKKVLLIAPQPFFELRGTPLNVRAMAETLADTGEFEVHLLVFPFGGPYAHQGVYLHRSAKPLFISTVPVGPSFQKLFLDFGLFFAAWRLSRGVAYDYFHGVEEGAFIAAWFSRKFRKPLICDIDSCMPTQLRESSIFGTTLASKLFGLLERRAIKQASAVLTVCTALSDKVRAMAPAVALFQIEDFPADGSGHGIPEIESRLRQELNLTPGTKLIVYTGNFERYQGIDLLLESFAQMTVTAETRLVLVGGGGPGRPQYEKYRDRAYTLGISDRVIFCGDRPMGEMSSFMSIAEVLVSPRTEGENTPLKLYSYMASGKPIVATNIYSHTQVLHAENAFLADPRADSFANALFAAIDSEPRARRQQQLVSAHAKREVEEKFSRRAFDSRLLALYRGLDGDTVRQEVESVEADRVELRQAKL